MLKRIFFVLALVFCIASSAMALENLAENEPQIAGTESTETENLSDASGKTESIINTEAAKDEFSGEAMYRKEFFADRLDRRLDKLTNLKKPEEFKSVFDCNPRARYNNVADYVNFICANEFSDEQLDVINRILENGTTIQSLIQVYEFWHTTDYDFSMIEEICVLEDEFFSEYWYESAFNYITGDVHGVLTSEDIDYYKEHGITVDEIMAANILCRREGQNIFDILDGVLAGTSIETQAMDIYGIDFLPEGDSIYRRVSDVTKPENKDTEVMVIDTENNELSLAKDELLSAKRQVIEEKISVELKRLYVSEPEISIYDDYRALLNSHYPVSVQRALINKGYTPEEIEKASQIGGWNIYKAAINAREVVKNEK